MRSRQSYALYTILAISPGLFAACKKKEEKKKVEVAVEASKLALAVEDTALRGLLAEEEYAGIGINYGDSQIESLKIKLTGVTLGEGVPGHGGVSHPLMDWSSDPKELEIAKGVNEVIQDTAVLEFGEDDADWTIKTVEIQMECRYAIKAWAYLDTNNDLTVDTTVWTTADAVMKAAGKLAKTEMTDYDSFEYGWTNMNCVSSVATGPGAYTDGEAKTESRTTILPEPVTISKDGGAVSLKLLVDSFMVAKVWDGSYGAHSAVEKGDGRVPYPNYPFPKMDNDSRGATTPLNDLFPQGEPTFGLHYIPAFAFLNTDNLHYETYYLSPDDAFNPVDSQIMTVIFDGETPILASVSGNDNTGSLYMGAAARVFELQADGTYTFHTSYGTKDDGGTEDGGLAYNNDADMAGHIVEGFETLALDAEGFLKMKSGPRCEGEYDMCVESADGWHAEKTILTDTNNDKYLKVYYKRVGAL